MWTAIALESMAEILCQGKLWYDYLPLDTRKEQAQQLAFIASCWIAQVSGSSCSTSDAQEFLGLLERGELTHAHFCRRLHEAVRLWTARL